MLRCKIPDKWESDKKDEQYYREQWIKMVRIAGLDSIENEYIENIFVQMRDANRHSGVNRRKWKLSEYSIIVCSSVIAFFNTIAATISNFSQILNIFAAVFAAVISVINGIKVLAAYRETWLRHSKFRSSLAMECHNFATDSGFYKTIAESGNNFEEIAAEKIKTFKNNTTQIIQDDYNSFFSNMRSS